MGHYAELIYGRKARFFSLYMSNGFPAGRSFLKNEIGVELCGEPPRLKIVWHRGDLIRELPRAFWLGVSLLFAMVGIFAIDQLVPRVVFVSAGVIGVCALNSRLTISITSTNFLQRVQSIGNIRIGVEHTELSKEAVFFARKINEVGGKSSYLVLQDGERIVEVLPIVADDNFDELCIRLNHALSLVRTDAK